LSLSFFLESFSPQLLPQPSFSQLPQPAQELEVDAMEAMDTTSPSRTKRMNLDMSLLSIFDSKINLEHPALFLTVHGGRSYDNEVFSAINRLDSLILRLCIFIFAAICPAHFLLAHVEHGQIHLGLAGFHHHGQEPTHHETEGSDDLSSELPSSEHSHLQVFFQGQPFFVLPEVSIARMFLLWHQECLDPAPHFIDQPPKSCF